MIRSELPLGSCAVAKAAQEPLFKEPPLLPDSAGSLSDHIDHDVRVGDGDGMGRVQLNDGRVGSVSFKPELFLGNDGIE